MAVVYGKAWYNDNGIRSRINNAILDEKKNIVCPHNSCSEIDARLVIENLNPTASAINQNVLGAIRAISLY